MPKKMDNSVLVEVEPYPVLSQSQRSVPHAIPEINYIALYTRQPPQRSCPCACRIVTIGLVIILFWWILEKILSNE